MADFHNRIDQALPFPDLCILHLELLAAFAQLRESVRQHDGLFGCHDDGDNSKADLRWTIYVANAVRRFEKWFHSLSEWGPGSWTDEGLRPSLSLDRCADGEAMDAVMSKTPRLPWDQQVLPPLDVLMVLHSYMLNPRDFLQDCLRNGLLSLWKAGFPWKYIETHLDPETFAYEPPPQCIDNYEGAFNESWRGLHDSSATICCPGCSMENSVPWTALYSGDITQTEKGNTPMPFETTCSTCRQAITQETLVMSRLRVHLQQLLDPAVGLCELPLPGTLLSADGLLMSSYTRKISGSKKHPVALNQLLLQDDFRKPLLKRLADDLSSQRPALSLDAFRNEVDMRIRSVEKPLSQAMSTALSRLIERHERNASPFALDLVGAVMRQGTFITKMQSFDWIRSPALDHTVTAAIKRYTGFFEIMAAFPTKVAVPTFDVDLVWHTHQLCPPNYYDYSLRHCSNVFIDHDDKIGDGELSNAFEWTCEKYEEITGVSYDKCLCWTCELLEESATTPTPKSKKAGSLASRIRSRIKNADVKNQPSPAEVEVIRIQLRKFEMDYAQLKEKSLSAGIDTPSKLEYFNTYTWHHPAFAPLPQELQV